MNKQLFKAILFRARLLSFFYLWAPNKGLNFMTERLDIDYSSFKNKGFGSTRVHFRSRLYPVKASSHPANSEDDAEYGDPSEAGYGDSHNAYYEILLKIKEEAKNWSEELTGLLIPMREALNSIGGSDLATKESNLYEFFELYEEFSYRMSKCIKWAQLYNRHKIFILTTKNSAKNPSINLSNSLYGNLVFIRTQTERDIYQIFASARSGFLGDLSYFFEKNLHLLIYNLDTYEYTINTFGLSVNEVELRNPSFLSDLFPMDPIKVFEFPSPSDDEEEEKKTENYIQKNVERYPFFFG
jgi:hypothetical protein